MTGLTRMNQRATAYLKVSYKHKCTRLCHTLLLMVAGPKRASLPKFDVGSMHKAGQREEQKLVDDGKGKLEIWRIENFERAPVDLGMYGQFFGGDSYVILYTYLLNGKENYIIYFWQVHMSLYVNFTLFLYIHICLTLYVPAVLSYLC